MIYIAQHLLRSTTTYSGTDEATRQKCDRLAALLGPRVDAFGYPEALGYVGVTSAQPVPQRRGRTNTETLLDVAKGLQKKVSLPKLIQLDDKIRPYLAALMVAALAHVGERLVIPDDVELRRVSRQRFEEHLAELAGRAYNKHGSLTKLLPSLPVAAPMDPIDGLQFDQHGLKSQVS